MWSLWMLISGFLILWAVEIRYKDLSNRLKTLELIFKELSDHLAELRRELRGSGVIKSFK